MSFSVGCNVVRNGNSKYITENFFVEILVRVFLLSSCEKTSMVEWVFFKIAGMHSRRAALL